MTTTHVLAKGKDLPPEFQGIINQLLGIVTWAAIATCVASLLALVITIEVSRQRSAENFDKLIKGIYVIIAVAGFTGVAAPYANWLYG